MGLRLFLAVACNAMKYLQIITLIYCLTFVCCKNPANKNSVTEHKDTTARAMKYESTFSYNISWLDSSKVVYVVDSSLTHYGRIFLCDSAIAIDYTGFLGEHTFMPLNGKGQWINTIKKTKKLSVGQLQLINSVFGDKKSFDNPIVIGCYEPRFGIVYFKNHKLIGQSAICLGCERLKSTVKLGNGENYSSFNEQTLRRLEKLCNDLQFSECKH
jgi:hypothetical protein